MTPDDVMQQYPGPVTLRAPVGFTVIMPAIFSVLTASLFFTDNPHYKSAAIVIGGFFALFAVVNWYRPTTIELTAWGFTTKDFGGAVTKCLWRDASAFSVCPGRVPYVSYRDRNYDNALLGNERSIPLAYPFSASDMAVLMNAWRERSNG